MRAGRGLQVPIGASKTGQDFVNEGVDMYMVNAGGDDCHDCVGSWQLGAWQKDRKNST